MSSASCWLKLTQALEHILRNHGLSSENVKELRFSIENESYWQHEAELLRRMSALQEAEIRDG
jgi:hypothetical protein